MRTWTKETLQNRKQDRLDDLEAFLGHLQRLRTPRKRDRGTTKKKIAKLKSEFDPEDNQEDLDEVRTSSKVPSSFKGKVDEIVYCIQERNKRFKRSKKYVECYQQYKGREKKILNTRGLNYLH